MLLDPQSEVVERTKLAKKPGNFSLNKRKITTKLLTIYAELIFTYVSIFHDLLCIDIYLRLNIFIIYTALIYYLHLSILWRTLNLSGFTTSYLIIYSKSIFIYSSILYNLLCIKIYLLLNILWFTLNPFFITPDFIIIYPALIFIYN